MNQVIVENALKITFFQCTPGTEYSLAQKLAKFCEDSPCIANYAILKGLGAYDIIFLHETKDFNDPIPFPISQAAILKTNLLMAFSYQASSIQQLFEKLKTCPAVSLSMLKLSLMRQSEPDFSINGMVSTILEVLPNSHVFGCLGWNEFVVITAEESIQAALNVVSSLSNSSLSDKAEKLASNINKSFSFLGINHSFLSLKEDVYNDEKYIAGELQKISCFQSEIDNSIELVLYLSCRPRLMEQVAAFWQERGFISSLSLGRFDLVVRRQRAQPLKWSDFIACLLYFRLNVPLVHSTQTSLRIRRLPVEPPRDLRTLKEDLIDAGSVSRRLESPFDVDVATKTLGPDMAIDLANIYGQLDGLYADSIIGDAFEDISEYPKYINFLLTHLGKYADDPKMRSYCFNIIFPCWGLLKEGVQSRLCGTFRNIEEVPTQFSGLRGGAQRVLRAMSFIPWNTLNNIDVPWAGFILAGADKFHHRSQVILVPDKAIWTPSYWWALYHEIGHILNEQKKWIQEDTPVVKRFLAQKSSKEMWVDLLLELGAEVVGYRFGFFGNYDLYFKKLWSYLGEIYPIHGTAGNFDEYMLRCFFVEIYDDLYHKKRLNQDDAQNEDYLYERLLPRINLAVNISNIPVRNPYIIAAYVARQIRDLYKFGEHINSVIMTEPLLNKEWSVENLQDEIKAWSNVIVGTTWEHDLACPEYLLYQLFKEDEIDFKTSMALIMTFEKLNVSKKRFY